MATSRGSLPVAAGSLEALGVSDASKTTTATRMEALRRENNDSYSYEDVDYRTLKWIYFWDPPRGSGWGGPPSANYELPS